ncbi:hypothetical protein ACH4D5_09620 [Streptomyces sp. NPDC018029]|uniref:hypothetical protein n=1 Tax=Streptomyces sp. NPDC018029 TaxID=3365032 RepID=UPI0037B42523
MGPRVDASYLSGLSGLSYLSGFSENRHPGTEPDGRDAAHGTKHVPPPFAPGHPGGQLGNATVGEGSSSRHGDLHAAAFGSRAPVRLQAGPGVPADPAPTRDRQRDIPEFPG